MGNLKAGLPMSLREQRIYFQAPVSSFTLEPVVGYSQLRFKLRPGATNNYRGFGALLTRSGGELQRKTVASKPVEKLNEQVINSVIKYLVTNLITKCLRSNKTNCSHRAAVAPDECQTGQTCQTKQTDPSPRGKAYCGLFARPSSPSC